MMVPGSNLLNQALRLVGRQTFQYVAFVSREVNSIGLDVPTYASPATVQGSVQPVPRKLVEEYGLDLQANYLMFYITKNLLDIARDISGDHILFGCKKYQCLSETKWFQVDGWVSILAVEVPV